MGKDEVGNCVQGCPPASPKQETEPESPSNDLNHFIEFNFLTESGDPISDDKGFTLIHPDGSKEEGVLSGGGFKRDGVPEGAFKLKFKYIDKCGWQHTTAAGEPRVAMWVNTKGMPDGVEVVFNVFGRFLSKQKPRATLKAHLHKNHGCATFKYKQQVGEAPGGEFIFEVEIGDKTGFSDVLTIARFPLDKMAGVQQELKRRGHDPGPTDGIFGPLTKAAVLEFQKDYPELVQDGIPGPLTRRVMSQV